MDYQKKFYEKFVNDNFIFLEKIRDKSKKRTYLKIMCGKCKSIELKEQNDLFKKNNIFCHCCNNRKKSKPLNIEDEIKKIEKNHDIKIINFEKKKNDIIIYSNCMDCGKIINKSLYQFTKIENNLKYGFRCIECANKKRKWINQFETNDVKNWFIKKGIEPLFDEYKNCYTKLKLKCKCGNIFEMSFKNRLHYDENWIPKCEECLDIERIKNYDYTYNRYTYRKKDSYWSKFIKNKFDNKCVITGESENIISHHLNGYNNYPEERYDPSNGVTLSEKLHVDFHNKYDKYKGDCTKEQFEVFYQSKTGKKFNIKNYESKIN